MRALLKAILKLARIVFAIALITTSLWALLLPPAFPYSSHAIVNASAIEIRAENRGVIHYETQTRNSTLNAGDRVASIKRDLSKAHRNIEEQQFARVKLEEQTKSFSGAISEFRQKLEKARTDFQSQKVETTKNLEKSKIVASETVDIYRMALDEAGLDVERVKPLFEDGIVTAAQWSETRQRKIEAEKQLKEAESELTAILDKIGATHGNSDGEASARAAILSYEQEISNLGIQRTEKVAELEELVQQIESAKNNNSSDESYEIKTPIRGVVWHQYAVNGELLVEDQIIAEIADVETLFIEAYFRRDFLNRISIGDRASVYLVGQSRIATGKVVDIQVQERTTRGRKIINAVEFDLSTLNVKIEVENKDLLPTDIGQFAKVLVSRRDTDLMDRVKIWLSLVLRSHKE